MKGYLVLALAGLALAIAAPSAFATRVIFDPPSGVGTGQGGALGLTFDSINNTFNLALRLSAARLLAALPYARAMG